MTNRLHVEGFSVLVPTASSDHLAGRADVESPKLDLGLLDRTLRRGLSETTRLFVHTAQRALQDAGAAASQVHVVFASAFGEIATAELMLRQAFEENAASPARFRQSVHNTAPGLMSISTDNRLPSTAIAAGWNTVAMGLCEASAQLGDGAERVLLVFADEQLPLALSDEHRYAPLGAAFVLCRQPPPKWRGALENLRRRPAGEAHASHADPLTGNNPLGPALLLVQALESGGRSTVSVGDGDSPWCIDVDARKVA